MKDHSDDRQYSTGEIALSMSIVFISLAVPTLAGLIYYLFYL